MLLAFPCSTQTKNKVFVECLLLSRPEVMLLLTGSWSSKPEVLTGSNTLCVLVHVGLVTSPSVPEVGLLGRK